MLHVKPLVVQNAHTAPGHPQKKGISPGAADCILSHCALKSVKSVSGVTQLSCAQSVANVGNVVPNLPVGARLQNFWRTWLELGAGPKVVHILQEGYTLPFRIRPRLTRTPTVMSCYANPRRNSYLLEALHQLIDKNAVEPVCHRTSLGFYNRLFLVPKPNQKWRPILDLSNLNQFLRVEKFKMETPETIRTSLQQGEWVTSVDFKDAYFHIPIQEQSRKIPKISCPGPDVPIQGVALWSVHSAHGVHCFSKRGETDGHTQGYKDPPVPRRLVGESQIPRNLSSSHPNPGQDVPGPRLVGEFRKVRAGTQAGLRFCRLPVRSQVRPGQTDPGPVAKPSGQDTSTSVITGLSGPTIYVPDRPTNSHREASSPRPTAHETPTVASQKQLDSTGISREDYSPTENPAPSLTMVARRRQCASRSTITPSKACSADIYRRIKRRVGRSLKRVHCKGVLVSARKQAAHKLSGTKSSLPGLKRVPKHMHKQHCPGGHRQYYGSGLYKQGRGNEVGSTVCSTVENLDLVFPATSDPKSPTYPWPTKCNSRQAIQAKPDHPNRMVPPSGHFPRLVQKMAPASDRPICHEVQQQVTSVRVPSAGHSGSSSGRTHPAMGGSRCLRLPTQAKWKP